MIYISGDIHGEIDIHKLSVKNFPEQKEMTKKDYVIICGDFGMPWYKPGEKYYNSDRYWIKWLNEKPFTTLFVDGNHENYDILNHLPETEMFGGTVGVVSDSIFHLKRGQIYTIDGMKIFTMGGAYSHDIECRKENVSWWRQEVPNQAERYMALDNLATHNNTVDYVITHCGPSEITTKISKYINADEYCKFLDIVDEKINYKHWYFGHYHEDIIVDEKHTAVYNYVFKIGEKYNYEK